MSEQKARALVEKYRQEQLFRYLPELSSAEREELFREVAALSWAFTEEGEDGAKGEITPISACSVEEIARQRDRFFAVGKQAIADGKVAAVLLAGGQGTRLGCNGPKGVFDIGITHPVYIFERLIENLRESCASCGGAHVPLYIMTSELNDAATQEFFREHAFFGYPEQDVAFFTQDMAPCTDEAGKILLAAKGRIALSPNGNGGWYSSLVRTGLLADAEKRGVEWFNVFAVDNVLQRIADPVFVGATILSGCLCGAKTVKKADPHERVGVLCYRGGLPDIVEYYELTEEMAQARDEKGELLYGEGVILNYLFRADRLAEIAGQRIPVHRVKKKVNYLGDDGEMVFAVKENAYKHETLILDMVRLAGSCLPFEVEREKEFAPVKNLTGTDSVESARALLEKNGIAL